MEIKNLALIIFGSILGGMGMCDGLSPSPFCEGACQLVHVRAATNQTRPAKP